ncbi:MAG: HEPN domain-containing protein [Gammaproteobacteria bacterium]|nr:HEPN domain-containing protein [Gammaproteobacteria bacterium]
MAFDTAAWEDRLAAALDGLEKVQEPYLQAYLERYPRERLIVNGRDETPFPLDDLRMVYAEARHSQRFGKGSESAPLRAALDPTRYALLSHPELERVAVAGRAVGENDFCMEVLDQGMSIWAGDLIAGLMARASESPGKGFGAAARELNAILSGAEDNAAADVLGDLDEGCDLVMFYGLTVTERIEVEDGMAIIPFREVQRFVNRELVTELAPSGAGYHSWRSVGAVIGPFRWRPYFRHTGSVNGPARPLPEVFFSSAQTLLDLLAVSHATPMVRLAKIKDCIDRSAAHLLGWEKHDAGVIQKRPAVGFDGFVECPTLSPSALEDAQEGFRMRQEADFRRIARHVTRLSEALARDGRVAMHDKVVDVVIALEGMYELPRNGKSRTLQGRVSNFLGADANDRKRITEIVRTAYDARSEIVHSDSKRVSPFRDDAAFMTGFDLARRTLFKLLREGPSDDWEKWGSVGN